MERHKLRHRGRQGGKAEIDFAMQWEADASHYAAWVIRKQGIRKLGAAAH